MLSAMPSRAPRQTTLHRLSPRLHVDRDPSLTPISASESIERMLSGHGSVQIMTGWPVHQESGGPGQSRAK